MVTVFSGEIFVGRDIFWCILIKSSNVQFLIEEPKFLLYTALCVFWLQVNVNFCVLIALSINRDQSMYLEKWWLYIHNVRPRNQLLCEIDSREWYMEKFFALVKYSLHCKLLKIFDRNYDAHNKIFQPCIFFFTKLILSHTVQKL